MVNVELAETDLCVEMLLLLCFNPVNKDVVLSIGLLPTLKKLYNTVSGWRTVGALYYTLKPAVLPDSAVVVSSTEEDKETGTETAPPSFRVMISYCWSDQPTVLKLRDVLKKHQIPYWIDVEHMQGDVIDCMAEAVESSTLILCCISPSYQVSGPCRQESTFASSLKKHIIPVRVDTVNLTGWLGVLMASMLYYDIGVDMRNTNNVRSLLTVLGDTYAAYCSAVAVHRVEAENKLTKSPTLWDMSCAEVLEWLRDKGLQRYVEIFQEHNICGASLYSLHLMLTDRMRLLSPDSTMTMLRVDLTMTLGDALKFTKLLTE